MNGSAVSDRIRLTKPLPLPIRAGHPRLPGKRRPEYRLVEVDSFAVAKVWKFFFFWRRGRNETWVQLRLTPSRLL